MYIYVYIYITKYRLTKTKRPLGLCLSLMNLLSVIKVGKQDNRCRQYFKPSIFDVKSLTNIDSRIYVKSKVITQRQRSKNLLCSLLFRKKLLHGCLYPKEGNDLRCKETDH